MTTTAVIGMHWGDEGKGKIIGYLGKEADIGARYNGADNAGHTIYRGDEKFTLHLLPSVVVLGKKAVIGRGVAVNPETLKKEIAEVQLRGLNVDLTIDERAKVITPKHIQRDIEENVKRIGSTAKGVGPCYGDWITRNGIMMIDYAEEHPEFKRFLGDVSLLVNRYIDEGKNVLIEGAQGTLLSPSHGTYPYVTSSEPTKGGVNIGLGIDEKRIDRTIGVAKAYITRVGKGPFPTELGTEEQTESENRDEQLKQEDIDKANLGESYYVGKFLRKKGGEYGTTTGRPRRTGWFDAVASRYASRINGLDELAITKLDVLSGLNELSVCTAYMPPDFECCTQPLLDFPTKLEGCKPLYIHTGGWHEDIRDKKHFDDIPKNAQTYIRTLEDMTNKKITIIGNGPKSEQIILR